MRRPVLDHGFVALVKVTGDLVDVANAARISYSGDDKTRPRDRDIRLVRRLWRDRHTSPFEMIDTIWEVKAPISVARQWVRHRTHSMNEESRRYTTGEVEFYRPSAWRARTNDNKQGSGEEIVDQSAATRVADNARDTAEAAYRSLLDMGVCPEQARGVLPVDTYTRWLWKQNLRNVLHFLSLRAHSDAQWEIRQYALAMRSMLFEAIPDLELVTMEEKW